MSCVEIREITSIGDLESFREPWTSLLDRSHQATVFGTWEWQYAAAKHLAGNDAVRIFTVFIDDKPAGILPMLQKRIKVGGIIPATALTCLGGGITDYNAMVVRKGMLSQVVPALVSHLEKIGLPVMLENVLPGSPLDILGRYLRKQHFGSAVCESKTALTARLGGDYDGFMRGMKRKFRKALRNNQNYMDRAGGYRYLSEQPSSDLLANLIRLHTLRWRHKGESGALAIRRIGDFHEELLSFPSPPYEIRYYTIRHDDAIAAILYGFVMGNRFYAYLSGFDMDHDRISPGNMIINYCIRRLFEEGIAVFDMLRGDMKYKQTWATAAYGMADTIFFPPDIAGRFLHGNMKAIQTLKRAVPTSVKEKMKSVINRHSE